MHYYFCSFFEENTPDADYLEYEWVKRETELGESVSISTSSILQINYLLPEDTGYYECIIKTDSGTSSSTFHLEIQNSQPKNNSLFFVFVEKHLKPNGRLEVLCNSGK